MTKSTLTFPFLFSSTVNVAFNRGLVVEPSGAAALAALLTGKVHFIHSTI